MTEPADPNRDDDVALPEPRRVPKNRLRLSLVWVVPLVALGIGLTLMVRSWLQVGPRIVIEFNTAEGLEAGKTEVRYKEVVVGRVDEVVLAPERRGVQVAVQLERSAAHLAVDDTRFWVVRPRIGSAGISGLGTLVSGVYIGVDAGTSTTAHTRFIGLEAPPFVLRGEPGRSFALQASDLGSLDVGSPVYYRRTPVGRVVGYALDTQRDRLSVQVFVQSPYDQLVNARTRFWNASGVNLALDAGGLTLNTTSLVSILAGGIAFERGPADAPPAADGATFALYPTRRAALAPPDGEPLPVRMVFEQSLRGLAPGAPVDFLGVEIGSVQSIALGYDRRGRFPVEVTAEIYPQRLGAVRDALMPAGTAATPAADVGMLQRLVDSGLRAQLRTGNLLTGQLYVAFDFVPRAAPARVETADRVPSIPTVPGTLSQLQPQVADIVNKLSRVPFDRIGVGLGETLAQARQTLSQLTPEAQGALAGARRAIEAAEKTLGAAGNSFGELDRTLGAAREGLGRFERDVLAGTSPLQRNAEQTLVDLQRAAQAMRALADYLQRHPEALLRGATADPDVAPTAPLPAPLPAPNR